MEKGITKREKKIGARTHKNRIKEKDELFKFGGSLKKSDMLKFGQRSLFSADGSRNRTKRDSYGLLPNIKTI